MHHWRGLTLERASSKGRLLAGVIEQELMFWKNGSLDHKTFCDAIRLGLEACTYDPGPSIARNIVKSGRRCSGGVGGFAFRQNQGDLGT